MKAKKEVKTEANNQQKKSDFPLFNYNHIKRFTLVIVTTLTVVLSSVALGYYLDNKLDTDHWFLIISLIFSFPMAQIMVYRQMKKYTQKEFDRLNIKRKN